MSKRKILISLTMMCALSTAAAAEGPKNGGVVNAVIQPEPPGLMMGLVQNGPTQMVAGNIYEGLLRYSPKLDPLPGLAESWTVSEDGKTYTFKLVKGVTWHDGKPFTSADVLFSIDFLKQTHPRARACVCFSISIENSTSAEVNGLPSCQVTPGLSLKV